MKKTLRHTTIDCAYKLMKSITVKLKLFFSSEKTNGGTRLKAERAANTGPNKNYNKGHTYIRHTNYRR